MKLFYSFILAVLLVPFGANAQIADYSVSGDWTSTDLNGAEHNLYSYTDSGYAVVMDLSATWCSPCWTLHQNGLLQDLHDTYGADGMNTMRIFYIESEDENTTDQLHGIGTSGGGSNRATDTQGDWVSDHTYPFIDDASIANPIYGLTAYPTLTMVGADRLTKSWVGSPGPSAQEIVDFAAEAKPIVEGTDVRTILYNGAELSLCGMFAPSVLIQNHGTDTLTSLDFDVIADGSVVASTTWTGVLLPYQTETIEFDEIDGSQYTDISVASTTTDLDPDNDEVALEGLTILGPNTTNNIFDLENTDPAPGIVDLPDNMQNDPASDWATLSVSKEDFNNVTQSVGGFEQSEFSMFFNFWSNTSGASLVYLDKIDMTTIPGNPYLFFNHAHSQYQTEEDRFIVQVSDNCGATWVNVWDRRGSELSTAGASTSFFVPVADDWQSNMVDLSDYATETELVIRLVGVSAYGNCLYVDDIKVEELSAVDNIPSIESAKLFPNPAVDMVTLELDLTSSEDVTISIVDQLGRVNKNIFAGEVLAGNNKIEMDVSQLAAGLYNVVVRHNNANTLNTIKLHIEE